MRHNVKKATLGRPRGQRRLLMKNLATSLILHEKIQTTEAKAKALQHVMESIITASKKSNKVSAIREVTAMLQNELAAKKAIESIGKKYQKKNSGFTRITHVGFRSGDAAPLVQIELT